MVSWHDRYAECDQQTCVKIVFDKIIGLVCARVKCDGQFKRNGRYKGYCWACVMSVLSKVYNLA